jgi:hypothetical protein
VALTKVLIIYQIYIILEFTSFTILLYPSPIIPGIILKISRKYQNKVGESKINKREQDFKGQLKSPEKLVVFSMSVLDT